MTTRAVLATYEPKHYHRKGYREPQAADFKGKRRRKGKNSSARTCLQSAADRTADHPVREGWGVAGIGSGAGSGRYGE